MFAQRSSGGSSRLSASDRILSSAIPLPPNPCFVYAVFAPLSSGQRHPESIELARRQILASNGSQSILDSVLHNVFIGNTSTLSLFLIATQDSIAEAQARLNGIRLQGLHLSECSSFTPMDVYPCSAQCSVIRVPCPRCLDPRTPRTSSSSACHLPREPLRAVYTRFHDAIRERLLEDIAQAAARRPGARPVHRLKAGFLLGMPPVSSEWGKGWDYHAISRPLTFCHLEIQVTPNRITIHPVIRSTHFLPFSVSAPSQGTAITLLPHGTPAYFLASYTGPTSALNAQFTQSLAGLGAGEWEGEYIIAWVNVQNKQGEDKGLTVIWPARLTLAFSPSHVVSRLQHIPDLPPQLQPSPPPPAPLQPAYVQQHRRACTSPTRESSLAFKSLTLTKGNDMYRSASQVSLYVDSVARDREREREQIRRDREVPTRPHLSVQPLALSSSRSHPSARNSAQAPPLSSGYLSAFPPPLSSSSYPPHSASSTASTSFPPYPTSASHVQPHLLYGSQTSSNSQAFGATNHQFYPSPPTQNNPPPTQALASPIDEDDDDGQSPLFEPSPPPTDQEEPPPTVDLALPASVVAMDGTSSIEVPTPMFPVDPYSEAWGQPPGNDFMKMDFDFGMDMDTGTSGVGRAGGCSVAYDREIDDAFTDDDFSFFDEPSTVLPPRVAQSMAMDFTNPSMPIDIPTLPSSSPMFSGVMQLPPSTPGLPSWVPAHDEPTPCLEGALAVPIAPVVPLTPPASRTGALTPSVQLSHFCEVENRAPSTRIFEPIPFAPSHRTTDGKYVRGKFSLPSPPDEEDRTVSLAFLSTSVPSLSSSGWRRQYNAETDFRVGVVRKLIGVKRKSFDQGSRPAKLPPVWMREHEDWESSCNSVVSPPAEEPDDSEDEAEENETPPTSRPNTPVPAYLPLGPMLLHTHFQHSQLLPLCTPLRSSTGAGASNMAMTSAPTSVPTPVSPAMMGAALEQTKSLESAALMLAKEIVENSVWSDAWTANAIGLGNPSLDKTEASPVDVKAVERILESIPAVKGPLDVGTMFDIGGPSLIPFESPLLSVAKSNAIVQVLPTALRFWDKLGLGPRGGRKNITAFVLYEEEEGDPGREAQADAWLAKISGTWLSKQLGTHAAGASTACTKSGIVPVQFASFRKFLSGFVSTLPASGSPVIFYLVTPPEVMRLASPLLRQLFSSVKRATQSSRDSQWHFQLVPEHVVFSQNHRTTDPYAEPEQFSVSVYDRLERRVDRAMSRPFFQFGQQSQVLLQEPAFTLARPLYNKVKYLKQVPVRSLDVVDRHTFLHVGYQISPCGKWVLAACVDQRGEAHDVGVWLNQGDTPFFSHIWKFVVQFAKKANIEWRIVITRLGAMSSRELSAWIAHLEEAVPTCRDLSMFHVSLLVAEDSNPLYLLSKPIVEKPYGGSSKDRDTTSTLYVDSSASVYAVHFAACYPVSSMSPSGDSPFVAEEEENSPPLDEIGLLPSASTALVRVPHDNGPTATLRVHLMHSIASPSSSLQVDVREAQAGIVRNYYDLVVLNQTRWRVWTGNSLLPFHLAAVDAMRRALDLGAIASSE